MNELVVVGIEVVIAVIAILLGWLMIRWTRREGQ